MFFQNNYGDIQDYVAKMLSNDPRTYEDATILVLNATEELGLAASEREALLSEGYNNIDINDAPEGEYQQGYALYAISDTKTGTKNLLETYYNTTSNSVSELPAGISQDYDFVIVINKTTSTEDD